MQIQHPQRRYVGLITPQLILFSGPNQHTFSRSEKRERTHVLANLPPANVQWAKGKSHEQLNVEVVLALPLRRCNETRKNQLEICSFDYDILETGGGKRLALVL